MPRRGQNRSMTPRLAVADRVILVFCAVLAVVSLVTVLIAFPSGTPNSSDTDAPLVPTWVTILPAVVGIALTLLLPWRAPTLVVAPARRERLTITTVVLLALAVAYPLTVSLLQLTGELYALAKVLLLLIVPAIVIPIWRGAVRIDAPRVSWRWWAPAIVIIVWMFLSQWAPWIPRHDFGGVSLDALIVAAIATAVSAGVGEELFYRRWLQTRLEAVLGAWPGIALASLAFALMHLGSHGTGEPLLDVARVVVAQGSFGLFVGVLWWRYRNLTAIILVHVLVNGWPVLAYVIGL